jgi:ketosteroid isomerase-like protein
MVAAYTIDGKIFPNRREIMGGSKDLLQYWTLPEGIKILKHKITPVEITIVKKTAYDHGYYERETLTAEGKKISWKGKYVIVWKKVGKDWKMYLDIWNGIDG